VSTGAYWAGRATSTGEARPAGSWRGGRSKAGAAVDAAAAMGGATGRVLRPCELAARRVPLGGRRGMGGGCAGAQLGGRGKAGAAVGAAAASGARLGGCCGRASSRRGGCHWAGVAAWPAGLPTPAAEGARPCFP